MHENKNDISQNNKTKMVFAVLKMFYSVTWKLRKRIFFYSLIDIISSASGPLIKVILSKLIIDELIGERRIEKIVLYAGITVGLNLLLTTLGTALFHSYARSKDYLDKKFAEMKTRKIMEIDFEYTEDPTVLDQINKAQEGLSWYSGGPVEFINIVRYIIIAILQLIGSATMFIFGYPILLVIIGITIVLLSYLNNKINDINVKSFIKLSGLNRAFSYYLYQILHIDFGKDIRLFNAKDMILNKSGNYKEMQSNEWRNNAEETLRYSRLSSLVSTVSDFFLYLTLGYGIIKKILSVGDFTMYTGLTYTLKESIRSIIYNIQELYKRGSYAYEFVKFMEYPDAKVKGTKKLHVKAGHKIEFRGVSFKYPRADDYTLSNVSIVIEEGEHLSVVGLNGAGKTTFIKLLCRLYDVTEGEILLDGVDIREYDYDEYIRAVSVVFQDFKLFAFTAAENVTLSEDNEAVADKLNQVIKLSGLLETVEHLKNGLDTYLYKEFEEDGTELSGGQNQKFAIARALYKDAPVIILDEPTAALDPMAEYEIYKQFHELIGGKTAIYISHRLSSCKFCDRIAVFSDNTIKEYGSHEELVKLENGVYAKMFAAQSQYYK